LRVQVSVLVVVIVRRVQSISDIYGLPRNVQAERSVRGGGSRVWIVLSSMWLFNDTGAAALYRNRVQRKTTAGGGSFPARS
jgi:hypothetical protein